MSQVTGFPRYLHHKDYEPKRVDNEEDEKHWINKGWRKQYIYKSYPKWVNGVIINSKKEEDLLLANTVSQPTVKVKKSIYKGDEQIIPEKPVKVDVDVEWKFEIVDANGDVVKNHKYTEWQAARAGQKKLNSKRPGHTARKIKG